MDQTLALRVLGRIMTWTDERARNEFAWLRLMARVKYDGYRDFQAGMRFIECLATWLQQFDSAERETAYAFIRQHLIYIGPSEMQRVVEQFYPSTVHSRLLEFVERKTGTKRYRILADPHATKEMGRSRRKTLFMALSDGARIDALRHVNVGRLTNEQMAVSTQLDTDKWKDLLQNLRDELGSPAEKFDLVYLVDDFMGTGTSFLRYKEDKKQWSGKLLKFRDSLAFATKTLKECPLSENWELCIHHYVASHDAARAIVNRESDYRKGLTKKALKNWAARVHFSFGLVLPDAIKIDKDKHRAFVDLTTKYYDPILRTRHTDVGGAKHLGLGYGGCALPVVLDRGVGYTSPSSQRCTSL